MIMVVNDNDCDIDYDKGDDYSRNTREISRVFSNAWSVLS